MERETKKFKAGEHEIEIKTYLTGREWEAIQSVYLDDVEVGMDQKFAIKGSKAQMATHKTIESFVFFPVRLKLLA